jgi:hypothetical protein
MFTLFRCAAALLLFSLLLSAQQPPPQNKPSTASHAPSNFPAEYATDGVGVFVENSGWEDLSQEIPSKIRTKGGLAGSLTYGVIPAVAIAEYSGQHAELQIETRRPVLSVCNFPSFPCGPVVVRLHPKKDLRELNAGRIPVLGAKIAEAKQSDVVPTEMAQPEGACWLLRPREDLPAGEYALMLPTQNFAIFAFTIANPPSANPATALKKP